MANNVQDIYSEDAQIKFAREMAKLLLKGRGAGPSASMAVLPGSWMYNVRDITDALSGAQYRDIAGSQEKLNKDLLVNPEAQPTLRKYGSPVSQVKPSGAHGTHAKSLLDHARELATKGSDVITKAVKTIPIKLPSAAAPEEAAPTPEAENADIETGAIPDGSATAAPDAPAVDPRVGNATPDNFLAELDKALVSVPEPQKGKLKSLLMQKYSQMTMRLGRPPSMQELKEGGTLTAGDRDISAPSMNLGGPKLEDVPAHLKHSGDTQLAQAKPFESQDAKPTQGEMIDIPGYRGFAPGAPYVETEQQIRNMLRTVPLDKSAEIINDWRNRQAPKTIPVPNGVLEITPKQGGGATYKFIPGDKTETVSPGSMGVKPGFGPDNKFGYQPVVPEGGIKGGKYEDTVKALGQVQSEIKGADTLRQQGLEDISEAKKLGMKALQLRNTIEEMKVTNETEWKPTGPTSAFFLKARQFLDNFGMLPKSLSESTQDAEVQKKLNTFLAQKAVGTFTDRGSNFELQSFMEANPGLLNTQAGTRVLLDILGQENDLQIKARRLADKESSESSPNFSKKMTELYEKTHITIPHEGKRIHLVPLSSAGSPEEAREMVERLPKGSWFWDPELKKAVKKK